MAATSVIIPTAGRPSISRTIEALNQQTRPPLEIIVVEDTEWRGVSWARNQGIKQAKGEFIAFTDDDCIPDSDWVERLENMIIQFDAGVAGGTFTETDPLLKDLRKRRNFPNQAQIDTEGHVGLGGNVMYRREWLDLCQKEYGHLFDVDVIGCEDYEFAYRIRELGAKFVFVPSNPLHLRKVSPMTYQRIQFLRGFGFFGILYCVKTKNLHPMQKSILWDKNGPQKALHWLVPAFFRKVLGPFDRNNFSSWNNFFQSWLGEKSQILGFLYGNLAGPKAGKRLVKSAIK